MQVQGVLGLLDGFRNQLSARLDGMDKRREKEAQELERFVAGNVEQTLAYNMRIPLLQVVSSWLAILSWCRNKSQTQWVASSWPSGGWRTSKGSRGTKGWRTETRNVNLFSQVSDHYSEACSGKHVQVLVPCRNNIKFTGARSDYIWYLAF